MHQVVCIKRVPDTETKVKIGSDGKSIDLSSVKYDISPYDEIALAAAVELKEKHGGEITLLTLGPGEAQKELRKCLAMGADRAVILKDDNPFRDPASTSTMLASYLSTVTFDLLYFGNKAVDSDGSQVGIRVAQKLDLPVISLATRIEVNDKEVTAHREIEGGEQVVAADLPCVITAQKGLSEPRHASLKGIMAAKKKPLEEIDIEATGEKLEIVSMETPPARTEGRIVGEGVEAVPELVRVLKEELKIL